MKSTVFSLLTFSALAIGLVFAVPGPGSTDNNANRANAADITCWHNNDCTSTWVGYDCSCANARRLFMAGMAQEGIRCWVGPGFGVGCDNDCGGKCDCGRNHHWEGSC